ncbi:GGDEF domain-containing protein [Acuticoccus sp. M5D2P5]|uniref:GGDEF domain-containing protein n=1 Tax=Acuticoccus kalidii TaxID=2910977 RepID=UPI001F459B8B|nr:GGDEF domain-containing protein [Acuticoccus kalidii]MCF3933380.1 GGDEF domain-containing protein [Acuticoccus kalidii]
MLNVIVLALVQIAIYFGVMLALFRYRRMLGIGMFFSALCGVTFAETYLATSVFLDVGPVSLSPGSVLLFPGKLFLLVLVYIREDAETVRQPIYGLLLGNLIITALIVLVGLQAPDTNAVAVTIISESAWLSVWGTFLLFVDCIAMIILYEKLSQLRLPLWVALWLTGAIILTADHLAFFSALHLFFDVPLSAFRDGFVGKMAVCLIYTTILWAYLRFMEHHEMGLGPDLRDVFVALTYRQRFEALDVVAKIDILTGARNRRALAEEGPRLVREATATGRPLSVLLVDIDAFKQVNDEYGHAAGDRALKFLVELIKSTLRDTDPVYRLGGDEFLIVLPNATANDANSIVEDLREAARDTAMPESPWSLHISIGKASTIEDGRSLDELLEAADKRLYRSKAHRPGRFAESPAPA